MLGMRFDQPVLCRNCLENIQDKYLSISTSYPEKSVRLNYFLAASEYFSELHCFDHDIALKLRPYGGLIGIDNSSLGKYLKASNFYVCTLFYTTQVVSYTKYITKDLVILICFRGKAATVLAGICRDYYFAYI